MSKVRVYELAKELGLENKDLVDRLAAMGVQVRNHMSVLEQAEVDRVKLRSAYRGVFLNG